MPPITDTRQRLIDAAGELFWERGYAATGLSDILESAGARGGSLYHFFPTKDDLLLAVIDRHVLVIQTTIENTLAAHDEPHGRVLAIVEFYRQFMRRTGFALGCPITNLAGEIGDSHPKAAAKIAEFNEWLARRVEQPLSEIMGTGEGEEKTIVIARAIVCMIQGAAVQARASKNETPLAACADAAAAMLEMSVRSPVVVMRGGALARA
jgi:AcrR family transcriptional regulator